MRNRSRSLLLPAIALAFSLFVVACGGSSSTESDATGDEGATTTVAVDEPSTTAAEAPAEDTTTTTTTTTEPPVAPLPVLDPDDVPGLIERWEDAMGDPLELAQLIVGFPVAVTVPAGAMPHRVSLDMNGSNPDEPWFWQWQYQATTETAPADIDIDLDEMGPGAIELRTTYDPIMADLGWSYSNSTGSDPSSGAGGPQSVNHVYQSDTETILVGGAEAVPRPLFVWLDEELVFGEGIPGYQIDVDFEIEPGIIPSPLINALIADIPALDGDRIVDIDVTSWDRGADSFGAEFGLRYIKVTVEWQLADGSAEEHRSTVPDGLGGIYQPGEESFFDPGFVEFEEPAIFGDDWSQPVVVLERYEGDVEIAEDASTGIATMTLDITFEAKRPVLQQMLDE